ncbi:hypothetical protein [Burkholderia latens]|uniref:hypothetical protein n=1 Tax=Burkholderia latens TaxID=488446 RepID=UPI00158F15B9|nr:hypothetical protein [Burkholderia latens]
MTLMMGELGNVKADNAQSATTQSAQLGVEMDQATQKACAAISKEFQKIADDLKTEEEKIQFWKWADELLNGVKVDGYLVWGSIKLPDGGEIWFGKPTDDPNDGDMWFCDGCLRIGKDSPLARAIVYAVKDFEEKTRKWFVDMRIY